ncbi:MAG TPA: glycoside hydrolase family 3 N-terminal domain-containing protein [Microbacterium sp.]|nr:glycoside hydrolase family 3 N-terminal domain-containing protein [Microbacterium sp.]
MLSKRRTRVLLALGVAAVVPLTIGMGASASAAPGGPNQPGIEARVNPTLHIGPFEFRDLNGNSKVDRYEDWRLPAKVRAHDLLKRMTVEEKAGLMHITSEGRGARPGGITSPNTNTVGYVEDRHIRHLILRDNPKASELATRANAYQEIAEGTRLGIPVVFTSNPRNHVNPTQQFGISEATGVFSLWPGTLGIAASGDETVSREFAEIAREEWRASGIHKIYGYQIETSTEPRWTRVNGTFGESPDLNAAIARELVLGFQGEQLGSDSVAQTVKHFPGDGPVDRGWDPHAEYGQYALYPTPGSLYDYQLPPFAAAIEAGASSVMSYYNIPRNEGSSQQLPRDLWYSDTQQFEEIAGAYSTQFLQGVLGDLGFEGYVNTDSGQLTDRAWGAQELSMPERYAKAITAGSALISDENDPTPLIEAVHAGLLSERDLDPKVTLLLEEIFTLGLFENPYVDPAVADSIADDAASQAVADEAHLKSVTLLRNDQDQLPITDARIAETRLFVEVQTRQNAATQTQQLKDLIAATDDDIVLVDTLEEATDALVVIRPSVAEGAGVVPNDIDLGPTTGVNVERVKQIEATVPTILAVNAVFPWILDEIEPGAASVVATFDIKMGALIDVIRGRFEPVGKLPISLPADLDAVNANAPDVPGYAESFDYSYVNAAGDEYEFGFGLSYE